MLASPSGSTLASLTRAHRLGPPQLDTSDQDGTLSQPFAAQHREREYTDDDPTQSVPTLLDESAPGFPPTAPQPRYASEQMALGGDLPHLWSVGALVADRYRLIEPVAAGAWGTVWQARQQGVDRLVAIKVLKSREGPSMQSARARFEREAKLASRIRHPSAVRIVEFGYENHHPFLVMEWLDGITLGELLRSCGSLSLELVLEIGAEVCAALHCAHEEGVIHRDLKPSNIMLVETSVGMTPVVVDFGLARTFEDDEPTVTRADVVIGTPAYMCPEAIRGHVLTPSSDIYSLGVTLLEALLGANPFRGESSAESMTNHLMPRTIDHEVLMAVGCSRTLAELFLSMVALELEERPLSFRSVESAFRAALLAPAPPVLELSRPLDSLQAVTIAAPVIEVSQQPAHRPFIRRHFRLAALGLSAGLALAALMLMWRPALPANSPPNESAALSAGVSLHGPPTAGDLLSNARSSETREDATGARPDESVPFAPSDAVSQPDAAALAPSPLVAEAQPSPSAEPNHALAEGTLTPFSADTTNAVVRSQALAVDTVPDRDGRPSGIEDTTVADRADAAVESGAEKTSARPADASAPRRSRARASGTNRPERGEAQSLGTLVVTAAPPGRIFVNGKDHGLRSSVMLRDVPSGSYRLRIERDGATTQRSVQLKGGARQVERF